MYHYSQLTDLWKHNLSKSLSKIDKMLDRSVDSQALQIDNEENADVFINE